MTLATLAPVVAHHPDDGQGGPRPVLVWRFPRRVRCAASGPFGGGLGDRHWIINAEVHDRYHREPEPHLRQIAAGLGLVGTGVGMLTATAVQRYRHARDGGVECVATVGLSHPMWAAATDPALRTAPCTINLLVWVPVALSDAALINAVATATEAKSQALFDAGIAGTGTASDAVAVCCPPGGVEPYGGPRSR